MGPEDRLLVYFAGHGETVPVRGGEEGYFLPVDAEREALPASAVPMEDVRRIGRRVKPKHVLFLLDACFSGFSVTRDVVPTATTDAYLASAVREPVVQVVTAGRKGERAIEEGGHGLFTRRLLDGLRGLADAEGRGIITAAQLAAWLEPRVVRDSDGRMHPQYSKLDGEGQFVFVRPGAQLAAPPRLPGESEAQRRRAEERAQLEAERRQIEEERRRLAEERARQEEQQKKLAEERRGAEQLLEQQRTLAALQKQQEEQRERDAAERRARQIRDWARNWQFTADYSVRCKVYTIFPGDFGTPTRKPFTITLVVTDVSESGEVTAELTMGKNSDGDVGVRAWRGTATAEALRLRPDGQPQTRERTVTLSEGRLDALRSGEGYDVTFSYTQETRGKILLDTSICRHEFSYSGPLR
jgi:uncharacterized caspase-like protein